MHSVFQTGECREGEGYYFCSFLKIVKLWKINWFLKTSSTPEIVNWKLNCMVSHQWVNVESNSKKKQNNLLLISGGIIVCFVWELQVSGAQSSCCFFFSCVQNFLAVVLRMLMHTLFLNVPIKELHVTAYMEGVHNMLKICENSSGNALKVWETVLNQRDKERQKICNITSHYLYRMAANLLQFRFQDRNTLCLLSQTAIMMAPCLMRFFEGSLVCMLPCAASCLQLQSQ